MATGINTHALRGAKDVAVYVPLDWPTIALCLGLLGLWLLLSAPVPSAVRAEKRAQRASRKASWAACKANRQAWRRRVFGSHPVLYGALFWLSAPVLLCLIAALAGP